MKKPYIKRNAAKKDDFYLNITSIISYIRQKIKMFRQKCSYYIKHRGINKKAIIINDFKK